MRRCVTAGLALATALGAGCGTVQNFTRPENGGERPLEVYGGTARSCDSLKEMCAADLVAAVHGAKRLPVSPLYLSDVVFSAVGDTLTLPVTVPVSLFRAIDKGIIDGFNDYYFPKGRVPQDTPPPPAEDNPNPLTPERIKGSIL